MESVVSLPRLILSEDDFRVIFEEKCKDFGIKFTDKLFQRFVKNQSKKTFLKIFEMESCSIGPLAACAAADTVFRYQNIRVIQLSGNNIGDKGATSFAALLSQTCRIISIDLSSNSIGEQGGFAIFKALEDNRSVVQLKIGSYSGVGRNSFGPKTFAQMREMFLHNKVLSEIDLSMTEITADTIQTVSKGLQRNKTIQIINLSNNNIQSKGAITLMKSLTYSQIRELNFSNNHIGDLASNQFVNFFNCNRTLQVLNLSGNSFTMKFTGGIAESLVSATSLQELNLSKNPLSGAGIAALGPAFVNNESIKTLNISYCKIDATGFDEFASFLIQNNHLQQLLIGHNPLRDAGAIRLAAVLKKHPALRNVDLELCEIGDPGSDAMFRVLLTNTVVDSISVKNNLIKNGIPIQTAVNDNPHILNLNIEFNDVDFKLFTDIQRQIKVNQKAWSDGQKSRIEQEVQNTAFSETNLHSTRGVITSQREEIANLEEVLEQAKRNADEALVSKTNNIAALEQLLQETSDKYLEAGRLNSEQGAEMNHQVEMMTDEKNNLDTRNDQELTNFKQFNKNVVVLDRNIEEMKEKIETETKELKASLIEARSRYLDMVQLLQEAYQERLNQEATAAALARAEEYAKAHPEDEAKKSTRSLGQSKGKQAKDTGGKEPKEKKGKKGKGKGKKGKKGATEETAQEPTASGIVDENTPQETINTQ